MLKLVTGIIILLIIIFGVNFYQNKFGKLKIIPNNSTKTINNLKAPNKIETVAKNLEIPWAIDFLPNGSILFTERSGKLKLISKNKVTTAAQIPDVKVYGEGGLMGLAVHPDFKSNNYIYLYYTYSGSNDQTRNRVVRYKYINNQLTDRVILIDNIPGAIYHNGGRLKFGPDKFLYITTGDSLEPSLAQNTNSTAGKILRVTDDGKMAPGNPFNNLVYSFGHRNPQGLAWDSSGRLWETEHGRSNPSGYDEINLIMKGKNYGWPEIQGTEKKEGMEAPLAQSGQETWAPAGAIFYKDSLFFGGLKGQALFELKINNGNAIITKHLLEKYGRIRDVTFGPDNLLYISTSNRDGRGSPTEDDDRIFQIDPSQL